MCKELACDVRHFLMLGVELDGVLEVSGLRFTHLHIVDAYAVVSECFTVNVTDGLANLKELLVLVNGLLVFAQVVVEHASRVVSSAFISGLAGTLAGERQDVVVLKPLLCSDHIVLVSVAHVEAAILLQHRGIQVLAPAPC